MSEFIHPISEQNINVIRALAVSNVYFYHASAYQGVTIPVFGTNGGLVGVFLFLMISGYLLAKSGSKHPIPTYIMHRICRIYPAYIFFFLSFGFLFGSITVNKIEQKPIEFLVSLIALAQLFPEALVDFSTLHVEWTLTLELLWYISVPFLLLFSRKRFFYCSSILIVFSFIWFFAASNGGLDPLYGGAEYMNKIHPGFQTLFIKRAFPAVIGFFLLGMIIFHYKDMIPSIPKFPLLFFIPLSFFDITTLADLGLNPFIPNALGQGALMIFLLKVQPVEWKWIEWISNISYSIYLTHAVVMVMLLTHYQLIGWSGFILGLITTLSLASLSFIAIERPAMRLARAGVRLGKR